MGKESYRGGLGSKKVAPAPRRKSVLTSMDDAELERYTVLYAHMQREELLELDRLFTTWDDDNSGAITVDEMATMLSRVVRDLFDQVDTDKSGQLDEGEVRDLVQALGQNMSNAEVRQAMAQMDPDQNGFVSFSEFSDWWGSLEGDKNASEEELKDLFCEVDTDGSGEIDRQEFIACIAGKMELLMAAPNATADPHLSRSAMQMVRVALMSVRDDVHAIYGMSHRPKSALQHAQEIETTIRNRRCFWTLEEGGRPLCVKFRKAWDAVQVVVLAYISITVPYRSGFNTEVKTYSFTFWFEAVIDVYFLFDIFLNMRTAYRTQEGDLITDPKEIRKNYFHSWFFIDAIACFPLTYIELITSEEGGVGGKLKTLKIFRLLRLAKMLRLAKLQTILKRLNDDYPGIWTVSKLSSLISVILYISHLFACLWYYAGSDDMTIGEGGGSREGEVVQGWVKRQGYSPEDGWSSWFEPWLDAYYYSITTLTTVGYGDRTGFTNREKIFSIITELAGGIIFGMLAGTLSSMVTESNATQAKAEEQLEALKTFMIQKRVKKTMRRDVMDQMEYYYKTRSVVEESEVLSKLPPKYRKALLLQMYKPQLMTCPLFTGLDELIITQLATMLQPYLAVKEDQVINEGEVGDEMYMLVKGEIKLESNMYNKFSGKTWSDGAFFGELPLLGMGDGPLRNKHVYSAVAQAESDLTFLRREQLESMETDHPVFKAQVRRLAAKRAARFGVEVTRVTVRAGGRRMSVAVDTANLADTGVTHNADALIHSAYQGNETLSSVDAAAAASAMHVANLEETGSENSDDGDGEDSSVGADVIRSLSSKVNKIETSLNSELPAVQQSISALDARITTEISTVLAALQSLQATATAIDVHTKHAGVRSTTSPMMGMDSDSEYDRGTSPEEAEEQPKTQDLGGWLAALGAAELEKSFRDHGFETVEDVAQSQMSESDLKELGVTKLRMRKVLVLAIAEQQRALGLVVFTDGWPPRSLSPPPASMATGYLLGEDGQSAMGGAGERPRTTDGVSLRSPLRVGAVAGGELSDAEIAQYRQLAVRAERQINARRQLNQLEAHYAERGDGGGHSLASELTPDERRRQRSMFGRRSPAGVGPALGASQRTSPAKRGVSGLANP